MSHRITPLFGAWCVLLALALPVVAQAEDPGAAQRNPRGNVSTRGSGDTAVVNASTRSTSGGGAGGAGQGGGAAGPPQPVATGKPLPFSRCYVPEPGVTRCKLAEKQAEPHIPASVAAAQAAASLQVPAPTIMIGPDPAKNQWNALAIGMPIWLHVTNAFNTSSHTTEDGIAIELSAHQDSLTVDWGDGTVITCTSTTQRPPNIDPRKKSPTCGHVYQDPAVYTITVTGNWIATWWAQNQAGDIPLTSTAHTTLEIAEFEAVVVG